MTGGSPGSSQQVLFSTPMKKAGPGQRDRALHTNLAAGAAFGTLRGLSS